MMGQKSKPLLVLLNSLPIELVLAHFECKGCSTTQEYNC